MVADKHTYTGRQGHYITSPPYRGRSNHAQQADAVAVVASSSVEHTEESSTIKSTSICFV